MIKLSTPTLRPKSYNDMKRDALGETHVSIQNEYGKEVRTIRMHNRADGIVEIEMNDVSENIPFSYARG
ncbi:MAG: hypothetical protein EOP53_22370 [Sphingobacteriales bacterium]|nr:MAG: hypothetical protein EOP53_22370 [Sphingobacteriales bacterium]